MRSERSNEMDISEWADLSDDELLARIQNRIGNDPRLAELIYHRDDPEQAAAINEILK